MYSFVYIFHSYVVFPWHDLDPRKSWTITVQYRLDYPKARSRRLLKQHPPPTCLFPEKRPLLRPINHRKLQLLVRPVPSWSVNCLRRNSGQKVSLRSGFCFCLDVCFFGAGLKKRCSWIRSKLLIMVFHWLHTRCAEVSSVRMSVCRKICSRISGIQDMGFWGCSANIFAGGDAGCWCCRVHWEDEDTCDVLGNYAD